MVTKTAVRTDSDCSRSFTDQTSDEDEDEDELEDEEYIYDNDYPGKRRWLLFMMGY